VEGEVVRSVALRAVGVNLVESEGKNCRVLMQGEKFVLWFKQIRLPPLEKRN
jgi:hypothetical protein